MNIFRLQKYDPSKYDDLGQYTLDEWAHVSEIGKIFGGKVFSRAEYICVEDSYIAVIADLLKTCEIDQLKVFSDGSGPRDVEVYEQYLFDVPIQEALNYPEGEWIGGDKLLTFCRLCLRSLQGHSVSNEKDFFIAFTGDLYVHVGCAVNADDLFSKARESGLYIMKLGEIGDKTLDNEFYLKLLPGSASATEPLPTN